MDPKELRRTAGRRAWLTTCALCTAGATRAIAALAFASLAACGADPAQPPPPPVVTVAHPLAKNITDWDEYTGRIEPVEAVEVRARVSGYLQSVHFDEGGTRPTSLTRTTLLASRLTRGTRRNAAQARRRALRGVRIASRNGARRRCDGRSRSARFSVGIRGICCGFGVGPRRRRHAYDALRAFLELAGVRSGTRPREHPRRKRGYGCRIVALRANRLDRPRRDRERAVRIHERTNAPGSPRSLRGSESASSGPRARALSGGRRQLPDGPRCRAAPARGARRACSERTDTALAFVLLYKALGGGWEAVDERLQAAN